MKVRINSNVFAEGVITDNGFYRNAECEVISESPYNYDSYKTGRKEVVAGKLYTLKSPTGELSTFSSNTVTIIN
jgi:hypothetical protein